MMNELGKAAMALMAIGCGVGLALGLAAALETGRQDCIDRGARAGMLASYSPQGCLLLPFPKRDRQRHPAAAR